MKCITALGAVVDLRCLRVDLDGDGENEVLISATNYFSKDSVPMRSRESQQACWKPISFPI
jgi:hypothetical protein